MCIVHAYAVFRYFLKRGSWNINSYYCSIIQMRVEKKEKETTPIIFDLWVAVAIISDRIALG